MSDSQRKALIIGASRGLGLGLVEGYLAQGWDVVATTRGRNDAGLTRLGAAQAERLRIVTFDVIDPSGLEDVVADAPFDLLFVVAGVASSRGKAGGEETPEDFARVMSTNAMAPMTIIERAGAHVRPGGVIAAMTSILGSVADNTSGGMELYRASKAALNSLLRSHAARHPDRPLVAMHPGWVQTDMGGANADVSVADSVQGMMRVIEQRTGQPGCVFLDYRGRTIAW